MIISIAFYGMFLLLLAILAVVAARVLGARDTSGPQRAAGLVPGCLLAVAFFVLAGLGFVALVGSLAVHAVGGVLEFVPDVQRIYVGTEPQRAFDEFPSFAPQEAQDPEPAPETRRRHGEDSERALHFVFELPGHDAAPAGMVPWFREWFGEEVRVRRTNRSDADGKPTTLIDVEVPTSARDLREIERDMRLLVPGASWAEGLNVEFEDAAGDD